MLTFWHTINCHFFKIRSTPLWLVRSGLSNWNQRDTYHRVHRGGVQPQREAQSRWGWFLFHSSHQELVGWSELVGDKQYMMDDQCIGILSTRLSRLTNVFPSFRFLSILATQGKCVNTVHPSTRPPPPFQMVKQCGVWRDTFCNGFSRRLSSLLLIFKIMITKIT